MFQPGRTVSINSNEITRSLVADEVLMYMLTGTGKGVKIISLWFRILGADFLLEPNAMEVVRLSANGIGGINVPLVKNFEVGMTIPVLFTATRIDGDGWSTPPTVSDVLGGGRPFNLSKGWGWSHASAGGPIIITPGTRVGFRIVDSISASMTFKVGAEVIFTGGV